MFKFKALPTLLATSLLVSLPVVADVCTETSTVEAQVGESRFWLFGWWGGDDSRTFSQFESNPGITANLINNIDRCNSSRWSVSGNTLFTTDGCIGNFEITGTSIVDCPVDPDPDPEPDPVLPDPDPTPDPEPDPEPTDPVDPSANLNIPDQPLTALSARVDPNVMLLIDNSGSMNHIVWDEGYNPSTTYTQWRYRNGNSWSNINAGSTYYPDNLGRDSCSSNYARFRLGNTNTYKCLRIPAPEGNSTRLQGNYLNYLLETYSHNTDLRSVIPNETRMQVARNVATNLVQNTSDVRFGVAAFNQNHGGIVLENCNSDNENALTTAISGLTATTWTPLSESYYEVTRYFRGLSSFYNSNLNYTSPIQYRCQKNFGVVITDGFPTYDNTFPTDDPDDPDQRLPNWDGLSSGKFSDGDNTNCNDTVGSSNNCSTEGHTLYLDDIAKFAWDIDMRKSGNDEAGKSFNDPEFPRQNLYTYTVGFLVANQMLENAAQYGNGEYYTADNAAQLEDVLSRALADIAAKTLSVSASASSQSTYSTDTRIFNTQFTPDVWTGDMRARELVRSGSSFSFTQGWSAASQLNSRSHTLRNVITNIGSDGIRWTASNTTLLDHLNLDAAADFVNYILGDNANEGTAANDYRVRTSKLGTIINSAPAYVGKPNFRYSDLLESSKYSDFIIAQEDRTPLIYVGSNSGMLHAFNAETGVEQFAYIPGSVHQKLPVLSQQNYEHTYFVNGSPTVRDAFVNGQWRTILVSGMGKGGQSIFALDITNPQQAVASNNTESLFMWEFTDTNDRDLGYTYSEPAIIRLNNGTWAVAFGNGYNNTVDDGRASSTGNAVLYIVSLEDGSLIRKINTGVGINQDSGSVQRSNGLSTITPIDITNNANTDFIYAGDLHGNLWKFDIRDESSAKWGVSNSGNPIFTACSDNQCNQRQPITNKPTVAKHPWGGFMVFFGTGKYLETNDKSADSNQQQAFYGIWDKDSSGVSRSQLLSQVATDMNYTFTTVNNTTKTESVRLVTNNRPNWAQHRGWYLNLPAQRERQITAPTLRNNKLIFTTLIPVIDSDPCASEADGYLMELDPLTGGRLAYSVFDFTESLSFVEGDKVITDGGTQVVSGRKLAGNLSEPLILADENDPDGLEYKIIGDHVIVENPGVGATGRQNWRQLYLEN